MTERNISLYIWYYSLSSFLTWLPIFFLYFDKFLSLQEIILLEAFYYVFVVILELPTGYFSDWLGRKITLLIGAVLLCLAVVLYITGDSFLSFAIAQFSFAGFMAFTSGTNTVFHYESLKQIGRESEYGHREAMVNRWSLIAGGTAALLGGIIGSWSLMWAYVLSLFTAVAALIIVLFFQEPDRRSENNQGVLSIIPQIRKSFTYLKVPLIGWIFSYYVVLFAMIHIPYEFYQPYLSILESRDMIGGTSAPVVSGVLYAITRFFSAYIAGRSMIWSDRIGVFPFLMVAMLVITGVIGIMGAVLHPIIVAVILFRGASWAAVKAPVNAILTPSIASGQRATFLSMMSLACRLLFFVVLFGLSFLSGGEDTADWISLSRIFQVCFLISIISLTILFVKGRQKQWT